ncbi:MAG TPA: hypothetical protein VET84_10860 [Stellaceae bacterium]|nr:hypothetical protein [Stellaceae bacterium]
MAEDRQIPRLVVPAVTAVVFGVLYALRSFGHETLYQTILLRWGVVPFNFPFLDTHFLLSSLQCWRQGVDIYVSNPCDALGRAFNYSPALLWARGLDVTTAQTAIAGLTVDALFLLSLLLLPLPRERTRAAYMLFATLSTMTAFAMERANMDLLVFALAALAGRLLLRGLVARLGAFAAIGAATLVKFYPAVLLTLTLRERPRIFLLVNGVFVAALAAFAVAYRAELSLAFANLPPRLYFGYMFGAANLPYGLAALVPGLPPSPLLVASTAVAVCYAAWLAFRPGFDVAWSRLDPAEAAFLVIGCALIVGCFFAGGSNGYRGVFLIFALPGWLALAQKAEATAIRTRFTIAVFLGLFVMWGEFFRLAIDRSVAGPWIEFAFWFGRELIWWWIVSVMGAVLLHFACSAEIFRASIGRIPLHVIFGRAE